MEERYPIYAEADIAIISQEGPHDVVVEDLLATLQIIWALEARRT